MTTQKTQSYQFFDRYRDEETGKWEYDLLAVEKCDGDAQAELWVNHLRDEGKIPTDMDGRPKRGLTIRRAGAEWYSTGV